MYGVIREWIYHRKISGHLGNMWVLSLHPHTHVHVILVILFFMYSRHSVFNSSPASHFKFLLLLSVAPNLHFPHLHQTQIYTNSNLHSSDSHTPKFTQPHIGIPKFTQLKFTPNWTQIYTALNLQRHRFTMCQTTGPQGHCLFWTN